MHFARVRPHPDLSPFVEWFWTTESDDTTPRKTKIVPDGLPEMIFHFGDPYRIRLKDRWQKQSRALLGGQLSQFCLLQNTGRSAIFGITFSPTGLTHLFGLTMSNFSDRVVTLPRVPAALGALESALKSERTPTARISVAEKFLQSFIPGPITDHPVEKCIRSMRRDNGTRSIASVCQEAGVTERQAQRLFDRYIGLSPKYYARILRFNHIFKLIREGNISWADVVYLSGYYDQSHFIRDFKKFTGEDPTGFSFREKSLTNFFTKKSGQVDLSGLSNRQDEGVPRLP